jgi:hypothetical protein
MPKEDFCGCSSGIKADRGTRINYGQEVCDFCLKPYASEIYADSETAAWAQARIDLRQSSEETRKSPIRGFGNIILKVWIFVIAICAIVIFIIFLSDPSSFNSDKKTPSCVTVNNPADPNNAYDSCADTQP